MASGARYALFDRARPAVRNKSESLEMFVNKEEAICSRLFALSVLSTREVSRQIVGKWFRPFHFAHYPRSVAELAQAPRGASTEQAGKIHCSVTRSLLQRYSSFAPTFGALCIGAR